MKRTLKLKKIHWGDRFQCFYDKDAPDHNGASVYPGVDGAVEYEITQEYNSEELAKVLKPGERAATEAELDKLRESNAPHEEFAKIGIINPYTTTNFQPFSQKGTHQIDGRNVWAWNGNREAPTLTPSFLMDYGKRNGEQMTKVHLFLTDGKINLLGDSNVELIA